MSTAEEEMYERLKKFNEPKGYFLCKDKAMALELIAGLLINKERYGYMSCPCRLATGERDSDKDIICPCAYREADVAKYGSCFCQLYVSKEWNEGSIPHAYVPESRSSEMILGHCK